MGKSKKQNMGTERKFVGYRDASRKNYGDRPKDEAKLGLEQINTGSFMRIADAVEKMSVNYTQMQRELEYAKESLDRYRKMYTKQLNSNRSLRGVITKLKNRKP